MIKGETNTYREAVRKGLSARYPIHSLMAGCRKGKTWTSSEGGSEKMDVDNPPSACSTTNTNIARRGSNLY